MQHITLENGLQLLLLPFADAHVFTLDIWVTVGSRYEAGYHSGIAHLTEHMLFKGTEKRTARDISVAVDHIGGLLNAYTGQEHTRYYMQTLGEYAGQAVELLTDMLLHPTIPERELQLERQVVLEEIAMYEDSPEDVAHDSLIRQVWQGSSLSAPISGTRESVTAIEREELLRFLQECYTPERMFIVCGGCFDAAAIEDMVRREFGSRPKGNGCPAAAAPVFTPGIVTCQKDNEQVCLELGFPGLSVDDPDRFTLTLLTALVGDGETSRLYQRLREELGLVYGVFAVQYACRDVGMYTISASTSPDKQRQVLQEIGGVLTRLLEQGITEEELQRTKVRIKTAFLMSLETVAARAAREGRNQRRFGRAVPVEEVLAAWEQVTCEDILRLARRLFSPVPALSAVGPVMPQQEYETVLATCFPAGRI